MQLALILSVVAPALVAAVLLAAGLALGPTRAGAWALALIAPLGAVAAYVSVRGVPSFPPSDASVWPMWLALVVAVVGTAVVGDGAASRARWPWRLIVSGLTAWLVCRPLIAASWTAGVAVTVVGVATVVLAGIWAALEARSVQVTGPAMPLALGALGGGTAAVLGASGTALLAQTAAGAGVGFGLATLLGLVRPELRVSSAVGPLIVIAGGFLLGGFCYAEVGLASLAMLAFGALIVAVLPIASEGPRWRTAIIYGVVLAVLSGAAIGTAVFPELDPTRAPEPAESESDDDYGY